MGNVVQRQCGSESVIEIAATTAWALAAHAATNINRRISQALSSILIGPRAPYKADNASSPSL
jgi:hypothetical protein